MCRAFWFEENLGVRSHGDKQHFATYTTVKQNTHFQSRETLLCQNLCTQQERASFAQKILEPQTSDRSLGQLKPFNSSHLPHWAIYSLVCFFSSCIYLSFPGIGLQDATLANTGLEPPSLGFKVSTSVSTTHWAIKPLVLSSSPHTFIFLARDSKI